jgi:hypothetical protein
LNIPKQAAENVWVVDGEPIHVAGLQMPVRMTVVRLRSGQLWLHSPTPFSEALKRALEAIGPIGHLVAPNVAHWSFVEDWQRHVDAVSWAAPNLRRRAVVKGSGVRFDQDLGEHPPEAWADDLEQAIIPGAGGFREVAFFHRASGTLVLTDLIVNLEPQKLPWATRAFAKITGTLAPDGKAPAYLRLIVRMRHREAADAATRLLSWQPERVIFTHGRWFESDGAAALRRSLRWLVK